MTEEIKEILYLQNYVDKYKSDEKVIIKGNRLTTPAMLDYLEVKDLLNYITNLQKENENYKQRNEKAIEYIENHTENIDRGRYYEDYVETYDLLNILQGGDE